ncbi:hypothetical protein A2U01_0073408, partial [Trifolium medium]|nr:hypothetical protein [Trifolium medium]
VEITSPLHPNTRMTINAKYIARYCTEPVDKAAQPAQPTPPATSTMDPELRSCFEFSWQQNAAFYRVNTSLNNSFYRFSLREQEPFEWPTPDNNAFAWP